MPAARGLGAGGVAVCLQLREQASIKESILKELQHGNCGVAMLVLAEVLWPDSVTCKICCDLKTTVRVDCQFANHFGRPQGDGLMRTLCRPGLRGAVGWPLVNTTASRPVPTPTAKAAFRYCGDSGGRPPPYQQAHSFCSRHIHSAAV